jgi:hypothetical protein
MAVDFVALTGFDAAADDSAAVVAAVFVAAEDARAAVVVALLVGGDATGTVLAALLDGGATAALAACAAWLPDDPAAWLAAAAGRPVGTPGTPGTWASATAAVSHIAAQASGTQRTTGPFGQGSRMPGAESGCKWCARLSLRRYTSRNRLLLRCGNRLGHTELTLDVAWYSGLVCGEARGIDRIYTLLDNAVRTGSSLYRGRPHR